VDSRGVAGVKMLVCTFPYTWRSGDLKLCTMSFLFGDVYIIGVVGSNYELWLIQEGWRM
jgi:hypothetical protein